MKDKFSIFFRFIWELPQNLVGVFILLYLLLIDNSIVRKKIKKSEDNKKIKLKLSKIYDMHIENSNFKLKKVTYVKKYVVEWNLGSAISLGNFIFLNDRYDYNTLMHEFGHTKQSLYLGPLYLIVVGIPSFIWCNCFYKYRVKNRVSYYSVYPENWADRLGNVKRGNQ